MPTPAPRRWPTCSSTRRPGHSGWWRGTSPANGELRRCNGSSTTRAPGTIVRSGSTSSPTSTFPCSSSGARRIACFHSAAWRISRASRARAAETARSSETQPSETAASDAGRATDSARESEQKPDDSADDDPEAQAEVEKSAAELEAVRKAEEKAGLLHQVPGAGPRDGISVGLDPADPVARDLSTALGTGLDGAPLADPAPAGSVSAKRPALLA